MSLKTRVTLTALLPAMLIYIALATALSKNMAFELAVFDRNSLITVVLSILCAAIQDVAPRNIKEVLVFWRLTDRLPGHRAYTEVCVGDTRIPAVYLEKVCRQHGTAHSAQNAFWYKSYQKCRSDPRVKHENYRYILWRDMNVFCVLLSVLNLVLFAIGYLDENDLVIMSSICGVCVVLCVGAARNAAVALVRNVVAIKSQGRQ